MAEVLRPVDPTNLRTGDHLLWDNTAAPLQLVYEVTSVDAYGNVDGKVIETRTGILPHVGQGPTRLAVDAPIQGSFYLIAHGCLCANCGEIGPDDDYLCEACRG